MPGRVLKHAQEQLAAVRTPPLRRYERLAQATRDPRLVAPQHRWWALFTQAGALAGGRWCMHAPATAPIRAAATTDTIAAILTFMASSPQCSGSGSPRKLIGTLPRLKLTLLAGASQAASGPRSGNDWPDWA